jgi:hypothetical protein
MALEYRLIYIALVFSGSLTGCGLYTPDKDPFTSDAISPSNDTRQGNYESGIVDHVTCEISQGLKEAKRLQIPWLEDWGTTVTQTITVEDQTGLSPGFSSIKPLQNVVVPFSTGGNVISPQSFSFSVGGTASVNALRTETIQYTFRNRDIVNYLCADEKRTGVLIDGDLKIREFIYDKATIAALGNANAYGNGKSLFRRPPFNTWTEEITFVAAYGASLTPTWKLARITANTSSNLFVTERTNTNDLIITLGPLAPVGPANTAISLNSAAMNQHNARVQANAIAVSVTGQSH